MNTVVAYAVSIILIILRVIIGLTVPPERMTGADFYKDMAHVIIGYMIGVWVMTKNNTYKWLIVVLIVVEVLVATLSRIL